MTIFCKLASVILFIGTFSVNAETTIEPTNPVSQIKSNITYNSKTLGLSEKAYKYAADQFMRLNSGSSTPDMQLIYEVPEFISPENYSEKELNQAMNEQKTKFANYFGISVSKLDPFIAHMAVAFDSDLFSGGISTFDTDEDMETITIFCEEACSGGTTSGGGIALGLSVYQGAVNAGISQYTDFKVEFVKNSTNDKVSTEVWRYNNFSGAWRESVISKPCPTSSYN
ncbi:hypothetical protein Q4596_00445 [Pseudoalteromonas carrageenovora]|uniref:hypothetical protein n=1 Tax=Pseudoalteromonas carrageenovora TaxID=227 RepID=UPI0026E229E7|nr:hypothetical protein [Pseudoalteromonas carrageenovora]MDO6834068.1 hypothetical protein [Pseudoalteromonas carrageenovora]